MRHPPSVSKHGMIRTGEKTEFIPYLKELASSSNSPLYIPAVDGAVGEGSVLLNQLKPNRPGGG